MRPSEAENHERSWKRSLVLTIARDEAHERWLRAGGPAVAEWDSEFAAFIASLNEGNELTFHHRYSWQTKSQRAFEEHARSFVRRGLARNSWFDRSVRGLSLGLRRKNAQDDIQLSPYSLLYLAALELALEFLDADESAPFAISFDAQLPRLSDGDVEFAERLKIDPAAAAGIGRLLSSRADAPSVADLWSNLDSDTATAKAQELARWFYDLRVTVLAEFVAALTSPTRQTAEAAEYLFLAPLLEYVAMRLGERRYPLLQPTSQSPYAVHSLDLKTAWSMFRAGRTHREIAAALRCSEFQLDDHLGPRHWRSWTVEELSRLLVVLAGEIPEMTSICDLIDASAQRRVNPSRDQGTHLTAGRSPWDVALRVASILHDYRPYWVGVQPLRMN